MTDPLNKLAHWREVTDKATEGPWRRDTHYRYKIVSPERQTIGHVNHPGPSRTIDGRVIESVIESINGSNGDFIAVSRTAMPALLTAVENVLKEHEESWSCGNPRHTNPEVGCPDCWVECDTCGCTYPCVTVMAIRDAIGGAQ